VFFFKNRFQRIIGILIILFGIVAVTLAILFTPAFAINNLSSDHNLTLDGIRKLTSYRYISALVGILLIVCGSILMREKRYTRLPMIAFFVVLTIIYYQIWKVRTDLSDTAYFGGDTWEYQSMGVNFAKGHGLQKFGALESFDTYRFENLNKSQRPYYDRFILEAGRDDFYRTPAYPLFLGIVYDLFGVNPKDAKVLQLLMLVIIAASLPFIGYHYWGKVGFIGGIPAGGLYLAMNYKLAEEIMTEPLIAFAVYLVIVALIIYEGRQRIITACLLGCTLGFALLVKGTLIFLPILTFGLILTNIVIKKNLGGQKRLLVILISTILTVLPWSIYASTKSGDFIFLSTQSGSLLLADNNELCIDGGWHKEWAENKAAFYNNDGIDNNRVIEKVINFYWHHPALFPRCMFAKFLLGFGPMPFLWIFMGFLLLGGMCRIIGRWVKSDFISNLTSISLTQIPASFWVVGGNFLLITLIFHAVGGLVVRSRNVAPMDFVFALLCCVSALTFFSNIFRNINLKHRRGEYKCVHRLAKFLGEMLLLN
jgi:hypothetical protein